MIDVSSLNNLISALSAETEQNAITPPAVANILQQISDLLAETASEKSSATTSDGLPHIYCQDIGGMLYIRGLENVNQTDYVPYLFRYSTKRNHHRNQGESQVYGPRKRGWHVYMDYERIKIASTGLVRFRDVISGSEKTNYYTNPRYAMGKANVIIDTYAQISSAEIGFGNKSYDVQKGVRFTFAIGFAPKWTDKKNAFDMKTLKTSLAKFHIFAKANAKVGVFDNIICGFSR